MLFYCNYHDKLEDADFVGYVEMFGEHLCDEAFDELCYEKEKEVEDERPTLSR